MTTAKHTISVLEQSRAAADKDKSVPGTPRNDALDSASRKISELTNTVEQQASDNTSLKKKVTSLESDVEKLKSESANKERKMEQERQKSKTANDTLKALKKELNEMKMVQQQIAFDSEKTLKEAEIKLLTEQNQRLSTQTDLERKLQKRVLDLVLPTELTAILRAKTRSSRAWIRSQAIEWKLVQSHFVLQRRVCQTCYDHETTRRELKATDGAREEHWIFTGRKLQVEGDA